jgi:hypothetical protein
LEKEKSGKNDPNYHVIKPGEYLAVLTVLAVRPSFVIVVFKSNRDGAAEAASMLFVSFAHFIVQVNVVITFLAFLLAIAEQRFGKPFCRRHGTERVVNRGHPDVMDRGYCRIQSKEEDCSVLVLLT